ncbi:MAG: hypothetical protein AB7E77_11720 [Desulfobulbus sp.]
MHATKDLGKGLIVITAILLMSMPAWAGNGKGSGSGKGSGTRTQSQLRDRSCQDAIGNATEQRLAAADPLLLLMGDKIPDRDRLRDGSCEDEG